MNGLDRLLAMNITRIGVGYTFAKIGKAYCPACKRWLAEDSFEQNFWFRLGHYPHCDCCRTEERNRLLGDLA
jgi:hypothetical protein